MTVEQVQDPIFARETYQGEDGPTRRGGGLKHHPRDLIRLVRRPKNGWGLHKGIFTKTEENTGYCNHSDGKPEEVL